MNNALTVNEKYNLSPSFVVDSWSQFIRNYGSSAASIVPKIPMGKYAEIKDKKLSGDSFIVFRRSDFDNLNMLSSMASKVTRCLMQIDEITTTFGNSEKPEQVIKLIHQEAKIGIEFTIIQSTSSASDYFSSFKVEGERNFIIPKSRKEITGK